MNNEIVFKNNIDAKKVFYDYKKANNFILNDHGEFKKYAYKIVDGVEYPHAIKLLEVFTDGNVILYFNKKTSNTAHTGVTSSGMGMMYTNFDYYLGVSGEDVVTDLRNGNTYSKRFKKIAKNTLAIVQN
ncbi:hypothetical protein [Mesonia aestuariivivens]|uniref:Uncharacterized protein n=1 Tax=Mesonia aestuariivivens TaxID=2796128 RepID=A0ABS6W2U1_9FLAO|nr:hypothetical protein [Mesonia aestuariivivens]MBW2962181.1 hypothetical protein [Mesonia aestuariivivens]